MGRPPTTAVPSKVGSAPGSGLRHAIPWIFALGVLTFSVGILAAAYMGSFMRLSGDDYCFGAVVKEYGFLRTQIHSYLDQPPYHGNRYSHTLVSGLASIAGPAASAALPGLTLVGWVAAAAWCGRQLATWARLRRPLLLGLLGAAAAVFLTVYQAPDRVQSVYWRSANIPYLVPLALDWVLLGLVLWQARSRRVRPVGLLATLLLAIFIGGFSEAAAAFQVTWLVFALGAAWALRRRPAVERGPLILALAVATGGAGFSLVAHAASPFARAGLENLGSHPSASVLLATSLRGGWGFLRETLQGLTLPTVVTFVLGATLGALLALEDGPESRRRWHLPAGAAMFLLAAAVVLAGAVEAPSLYAYNALPDARAQLASRHVMVLAFLAIGLAAGFAVIAVLPPGKKRLPLLAGILAAIVVATVYPLWGASQIVVDVPTYRRWANAWDARHAEILCARETGEVNLHVMLIDHIIPSVSELTDDPAFWYNVCAAGSYGVESITADLPGWDD